MAKGYDIVPTPGTERRLYLEENAAAADINRSADDVAQLDEAVPLGAVSGGRYVESDAALVNH